MRIAQIAPLYESVPPRLYGGTERIVSYLTEELVRLGHDVTLFASGDSRTEAELIACCPTGLRLNDAVRDPLPHHLVMLEEVRRRGDEFDVIHFHTDLLQFSLKRSLQNRALTTLHGRLDMADLVPFYRTFHDTPLVSISDSQRSPLGPVNWLGTVYHGLPGNLLRFEPKPSGGYLAFLGRISPEKGPAQAIEIAVRAGLPLKMAAKIDRGDERYWEDCIKPLVAAHPNVEFIGEIGEDRKGDFLGNARALLFPIDWEEPFGLVMIEAMACGTPVVAFPRGSVPEVIDSGVSGFVVASVAEAAAAARAAEDLSRSEIRLCFERRFTAERMARDYLAIYSKLIAGQRPSFGALKIVDGGVTAEEPEFAAAAG
jgi:glycosyltransferase involved in cell wall biosynthesis